MKSHHVLSPLFALLFLFIISCNSDKLVPTSNSSIDFTDLPGNELINKSIVLQNGDFALAGAVNNDAFIAIVSDDGRVKHFTKQGGEGQDKFLDIIELSNGNLLAVGATLSVSEGASNRIVSDGYIIEFSSKAEIIAKKVIGTAKLAEVFNSVFQDNQGNIVLIGYQEVANTQTYIVKLNPSLEITWTKTFYIGPWHSFARSICQTTSGDYMLAGLCSESGIAQFTRNYNTFILKINKSVGDTLFSRIYNEFPRKNQFTGSLGALVPLIIKPEGDGYVWFTFIEENNFEGKGQYVKLSSSGEILLERQYRGLRVFLPSNAFQLPDNNYLLVGVSSKDKFGAEGFTNAQSTVIKIDKDGNEIWQSNVGSNLGLQYCFAVKNVESDNIRVLSGTYYTDIMALSLTMYLLSSTGDMLP